MAAGPREVFAAYQRSVLANQVGVRDDVFAEDVVVEWPFARPGTPKRIEGRAEFLAFATPRRAALPVTFEEFRDVVLHDTADPEVIVAEYELVGTVAGRRSAASMVTVLRVRAGRVVHVREYQDTAAIAAALNP